MCVELDLRYCVNIIIKKKKQSQNTVVLIVKNDLHSLLITFNQNHYVSFVFVCILLAYLALKCIQKTLQLRVLYRYNL